jgi:phospholipid/cholesterol/gamma-HCH transport system ATP-binding protein
MGMTIVVVTHELESAFKIADRICVVDDGEIIALGNRDEIRASGSERVQNLLNRRSEETALDPDAYLRRLFGDG